MGRTSGQLGDYVAAAVAPPPSGDGSGATDTPALQAWMNKSTAAAPLWLVLPAGTYYTNEPLVFPKASGTRMSGAGADVTIIQQQTAGVPIKRFTQQDIKGVTMENLTLQYGTQQTNAGSQAITYDAGQTVDGWYHHTYRDMIIRNAYDAWAIITAAGQQAPVWDTLWDRVTCYAIKHSCWNLSPSSAIGMPQLSWRNVAVINTGGGPTPTGPVWNLLAGEANISGADVEGWANDVIDLIGGTYVALEGLHLENHTMSSAGGTPLLFHIQQSFARMRDLSLVVTVSTAGGGYSQLWWLDSGTSLTVDNLIMNFTNNSGVPVRFATGSSSNVTRIGPMLTNVGNVVTMPTSTNLFGCVVKQDGIAGALTAPGIPASTSPLTNPFPQDCAVNITGGTVTAIAVAGTPTGLTSGTVVIPAGETVTLTYSVAPTWIWTGL